MKMAECLTLLPFGKGEMLFRCRFKILQGTSDSLRMQSDAGSFSASHGFVPRQPQKPENVLNECDKNLISGLMPRKI